MEQNTSATIGKLDFFSLQKNINNMTRILNILYESLFEKAVPLVISKREGRMQNYELYCRLILLQLFGKFFRGRFSTSLIFLGEQPDEYFRSYQIFSFLTPICGVKSIRYTSFFIDYDLEYGKLEHYNYYSFNVLAIELFNIAISLLKQTMMGRYCILRIIGSAVFTFFEFEQ